jgi:predicted dehydrogenase
MGTGSTRREFLGKVARGAIAAGAAMTMPYVVSGRALGAEDKVPASERLTMGFIGVGGMGSGHLGAFLGRREVEVLAVCDVSEPNRMRAKERVGDQCAAYNDFRDLLDRQDIDAVLIATPDHWHVLVAMAACQAGKDIYCEKPLTLTIEEGRALVNAVRRYGRVFQTGSQQRSDNNFRFACELVRSGRIGKLQTIRTWFGGAPASDWELDGDPPDGLDWDLWLGPARWVRYNKLRCPYNFRWFYDYSGGKMTDWGAHHNDIAQWGNGTELSGPIEIEGTATFPTYGLYDTATTFTINYTYANGVKVICGGDQLDGRGEGIRFYGTEGWVHVDRGLLKASPPELLQEQLGPGDVHLYRSDSHHQNWLDCIKTREKPICDVEIGHRSVSVCHLGNIAIRTGRKLHWDPERERFVGDEDLNRWLSRPMRAPWHL